MNLSTYSLRRLLALVLALVMCSAVFAGCGKTNGDPTEPSETITETAEPTETEEPTEEATEEPTEPEVTVPPVVMGTVNAGPLNVRSEPYTTADILKRLDLDTRIEIYEQKIIDGVNWGRIAEGWINMNYVTIDGDETTEPTGSSVENDNNIGSGDVNISAGANAGVVTADELNIRETASSNAKSLGKYVKGDVINILEKKGSWGRTSKGWVNLSYVKMEGSGSTGSSTGTGTGTSSGTSTPGTTTANTMVSNGKTTVLGYGMVSKVTALNVRYGPGTSYDAATYISAGQRLPYYQESGNWVRIKSGWVSLSYFDIISDIPEGAEGTVTTTNLNIRAKASSSSKDLGNLKKGDEVTILEVDGNWGKIEYEEGEYGWISLSYVLFDTDTTTTYTTGDGEVTAYQLNVRKEADPDSKSLTTLEKGDDVTILEVDGNWGKIEYKSGKYGWINLNYVEMDKVYTTGDAVVTASGLNVRKSGDEDSKVLTTLKRGDEVTILEVDDGWGKIEYKSGKYGWINLDYVKMTDGESGSGSDSDDDSDDDTDTDTKYSITINTAENGKITASTTSCKAGTVVTLTAVPNKGYVLDTLTAMNTTKNEAVAVSDGKFTMPAGKVNVVATFKKADADTYSVTVNTVTNGKVSANTTACTAGSTVTLTVIPNSGYVLESLSVKDAANNTVTVSDNTFTMPAANVTVAASFKKAKYTVSIGEFTNGAVSVNPDTYEKGATVSLIITPAEGYALDTLTVKDASDEKVTVNSKNQFTMPGANVSVDATFKKVQYTLTIDKAKNGSVTADKTTYEIGDTITLTVKANEGYEVDKLTVKNADGEEITVTDNAFTAPGSKVTVTVTFKAI